MAAARLSVFFLSLLIASVGSPGFAEPPSTPIVTYKFVEQDGEGLDDRQRAAFKQKTKSALVDVHALLPTLEPEIQITVRTTERDLSVVHGVTGRADRPNELEIELSSSYTGGLDGAMAAGLRSTLFHELHHTVHGWTIHENIFPAGIDTAIVMEGLADVFAEIHAGSQLPSPYNDTPDFAAWTAEIQALPKDADYGTWMFSHPDGRQAIGYRTGAWLVKTAAENSGKSVLELSQLSIAEIYSLAGY